MGRWRLKEDRGNERWTSALVDMVEDGDTVTFRQIHGVQPWESADPSSLRVWWNDAGVHQNITFPVHPDPISGMHCWHQKVRVRAAEPGDRYADIHVDFAKSRAVYRKWLALARPAAGELRRPIWLFRPVKPVLDAYALPEDERTLAARELLQRHDLPGADDLATLVDWDPAAVWGEPARAGGGLMSGRESSASHAPGRHREEDGAWSRHSSRDKADPSVQTPAGAFTDGPVAGAESDDPSDSG